MPAPSSVLVVAAHPDDEILGCGGTMTRLAREGHEVRIAILAEGMSSRYAQREDADPQQLQHLHARAQQAADKVGAKELVLCKLPDNRLDTVPLLEVVKTGGGIGGAVPAGSDLHASSRRLECGSWSGASGGADRDPPGGGAMRERDLCLRSSFVHRVGIPAVRAGVPSQCFRGHYGDAGDEDRGAGLLRHGDAEISRTRVRRKHCARSPHAGAAWRVCRRWKHSS